MSSRFTFALSIAVLCAGCSVDGIDGVFGQGDDESGGGRSGSGGSGGQGGRNPTTDVTTSDPDNTTSNPQQTNTTGNPDTTTTEDGPTTDTGPSTTTGPLDGPTVFCNDLPCEPGQVCCYYQFSAGFDHCSAPGQCEQEEGWVEHSCNGPDDCDGGECCGLYGSNGWESIHCKPMCSDGDTELCEGAPQACDVGICQPSGALGVGYSRCGT